MNTELILRVADAIENETVPGLRYDQDQFRDQTACGTTTCIAGWAWSLEHGGSGDIPITPWLFAPAHVYRQAQKSMGLDDEQAHALMMHEALKRRSYDEDSDSEPAPITRQEAAATLRHLAATLRHLAATGRVEWVELPETWENAS